eukprot:4529648-Prymnesium_polylepis.1
MHQNPPQGQQIERHAPLRLRGESKAAPGSTPGGDLHLLPWPAPDRRGASQGAGRQRTHSGSRLTRAE